MKENSRTLLILHAAVFLAGWTGIFGRLIQLGGLPLVWYRIMVSVVTMVLVLAVMGRLHKVDRTALLQIAGCGVLLALHWTAFFASIQASNVSIGVACIATTCFFTTISDPLINRKAVSWTEILISFISIAGVLLIFSLDVRYRLGIALGLLSAAIYSVFAVYNVRIADRTGEPSDTMLFYELIGGVLFLTLCMPFYMKLFPGESVVPAGHDLLWLLLLGSLFTVVPFLFQLHALRKLSAFTVNLTYNLEPVYSIAIAAILFDEIHEVGWSFWIGLALIVLSVILQNRRVVRKPSAAQRQSEKISSSISTPSGSG